MIILGIDPALTCLGWGIIKSDFSKIEYISSGLIKTKSKDFMPDRLAFIASSIEEVIDTYKPDAVAMEETFVNRNASSSLKLGYVRGTLMALIGKIKLPYSEFTPNKIKKTISGFGHAEKDQVLKMVKMIILGTREDIKFDESDALATAYTYLVHDTKEI
jgi:crossover junction endodeoxyribonuclease RuvC